MDTPTVLIVVAWLAIWLLWPRNGADRPRLRVPASASVGYLAGGPAAPWYVEPDWFARTTRPGFGMPDVTAAMDSAVPDRSMVESPRFVEGGMEVERPGGGAMPETGTNAGYLVRWPSRPAFLPAAPAPPVVVTMSAELTGCRFDLPADPLPPGTNGVRTQPDKPWQVVAHVDVGTDGRTENVLIELGCEDSRLNATIARWLQRGVAGRAGAPVSGRITISGPGSNR
jgi:hypothetical protein